jgi:CRISPR-associated helicase Cas3/CRISPR-associated endonuclease Cas3-HD
MSPDLYAKSHPPLSLPTHTADVREVLEEIVTASETVLAKVADVSQSRLRTLTDLCGRLHDVGKAHPDWQAACRAHMDGDFAKIPPHAARSAVYAAKGLPILDETIAAPERRAVTLAILHHHTPCTARRMRPDRLRETLRPTTPEFQQYLESVSQLGLPKVTVDTVFRDEFCRELEKLRNWTPTTAEYVSLGRLVTVLRSLLIQADQYASAKRGGNSTVANPCARLDVTAFDLFESLRPFQRQVAATDTTRLTGIAGCGEGKTHAALQWGRDRVDAGQIDRLVFAMPTRVTSNNLLVEITGDDGHLPPASGGLYHSAAESFYQSSPARQRWDVSEEIRRERERRWFQTPVTVTTVDHVLATLVNGYPNAGVARGNLLRAGIVFDEVHAYDTTLLTRLRNALQELDTYDVPWFLMTATLPHELRTTAPVAKSTQVISDGRLAADEPPREPFVVETTTDPLDAAAVEAACAETESLRTLVIKNTVDEAHSLATTLQERGHDVLYFSSEFPRVDRAAKEAALRDRLRESEDERTIAVTTQICEISLDLSADLLLTDLAPIDAIFQRAGRLHRDGVATTAASCRSQTDRCSQCRTLPATHRYRCRVHRPPSVETSESLLPYATADDDEMWTVLERTATELTAMDTYRFEDSCDRLERVYRDVDLPASREFTRAAQRDLLYGPPRQIGGQATSEYGKPLTLREISSYRRDVLARHYRIHDGTAFTPTERWTAEHDCRSGTCGIHDEEWTTCDDAVWSFMQRYSVPVPVWWLDSGRVRTDPLFGVESATIDPPVVDLEYTFDGGLERP